MAKVVVIINCTCGKVVNPNTLAAHLDSHEHRKGVAHASKQAGPEKPASKAA